MFLQFQTTQTHGVFLAEVLHFSICQALSCGETIGEWTPRYDRGPSSNRKSPEKTETPIRSHLVGTDDAIWLLKYIQKTAVATESHINGDTSWRNGDLREAKIGEGAARINTIAGDRAGWG